MKRLVQLFFLCAALLPLAWYKLFSLFMEKKDAFLDVSQFMSLWPGRIGRMFRAAFYTLALPKTSQNINLEFLTTISSPDASFSDHLNTGPGCNIGWAEVGPDCLIGSYTCILSGKNQHGYSELDTPIRLQEGNLTKITIGRNCWIGVSCVIMADIGDECIIAAGSVVTKPIPPYCIAAGNPAKIIRSRKVEQNPV